MAIRQRCQRCGKQWSLGGGYRFAAECPRCAKACISIRRLMDRGRDERFDAILQERLGGATCEEIGVRFNLSRERIRQIVNDGPKGTQLLSIGLVGAIIAEALCDA